MSGPPELAAWATLARGWHVELGPAWLGAEWARVTPRSAIAVGEGAAASWMLVDGSEERTGFVAYDLLLDSYVDDASREAGQTAPADHEQCAAVRARAAPLRTALTATIATTSALFPGIVWDRGLAEEDARRAVRGVVGQVVAAAKGRGASLVAVANVPDTDEFAPLRRALEDLGLVRAESAPDCTLSLPEGGFEAYVSSIRQSRRSRVRREKRIFQEAVDRVVLDDASRLRDASLVPMLMGHRAKYGHTNSEASAHDRLARLASYGDDVKVMVAEKGGRALGFIVFVRDHARPRLVPRMFACEDNDVYVYFNLVFYETVQLGALHGFRELVLGSTAYAAKLLRGARLRRRSTWLAVLDEDLRGVVEEAAAYRTQVEAARRAALVALES